MAAYNLKIDCYGFYQKIQSLNFVEKIILFGSRSRGDNKERSDIDLAIFCPLASDVEWLQILDIIDNADTLLKIDCVRLDALSLDSHLRHNILKEGTELHVKSNI